MIQAARILVLGGTSDSIELANRLLELCPDTMLSTATEYGSSISGERFGGILTSGRKDRQQLVEFIKTNEVNVLIDATHPYASGVSQNSIRACEDSCIAYIRYERKSGIKDSRTVTYCDSYKEAARIAESVQGNILVTTGSNNIERFTDGIRDKKRLKIRVLPVSESIAKLEMLGFCADNIIAMKGPFSEEMNYLMLVENKIRLLVCKDSGEQGGTENKLKAAEKAGVSTLVIKRPQIVYPNNFGSIEEVVEHLNIILKAGK